jgi:hypothetical protein
MIRMPAGPADPARHRGRPRGRAVGPGRARDLEKKGCRWWSARRRKLRSKPGSCAYPHRTAATLGKAGAWSASLGARVPRAKYAVLVRVRDGAGALTDVKFKNRRLGR